MIERLAKRRDDSGFTLVELLVVIVILGILAAIVVFAVTGISDRGQTASCKADLKALQTAEEAYYAKNTTYASNTELSTSFLKNTSEWYTVTSHDSSGYTITWTTTGSTACSGVPA